MKLISTRNAGVDRLKVLVHGPAGAGKTYLASTTGNHRSTMVLSAEAGLLSLRGFEINAIEIDSVQMARSQRIPFSGLSWTPFRRLQRTAFRT